MDSIDFHRGSGDPGRTVYPIGCNGNVDAFGGSIVAHGVDTMWAVPFYVKRPITLAKATIFTFVSAGAGGKGLIGICANKAGGVLYPGKKIAACAEFDTTIAAGVWAQNLSTIIDPGWNWGVWYPGVAAPSLFDIADIGWDDSLGWTPGLGVVACIKVARAYDGIFPDFPAGGSQHGTANQRPAIWLEFSA